ncbi:MAG: hypothetical protein ACFFCQ_08070 [Promethearchaeota archaeon]
MTDNKIPSTEDIWRIMLIGPQQSGKSSILSQISSGKSIVDEVKNLIHFTLLGEEFIFVSYDIEEIKAQMSDPDEQGMIFSEIQACVFLVDVTRVSNQENRVSEDIHKIMCSVREYAPEATRAVFLHKSDLKTEHESQYRRLRKDTINIDVYYTSIFDSSIFESISIVLRHFWARINTITKEFKQIAQELELASIKILAITGLPLVNITLDENIVLPPVKDLIDHLIRLQINLKQSMSHLFKQELEIDTVMISGFPYNFSFGLIESNTILLVIARDTDNLQMAFTRLTEIVFATRPSMDVEKSQKWADWKRLRPKYSERRKELI